MNGSFYKDIGKGTVTTRGRVLNLLLGSLVVSHGKVSARRALYSQGEGELSGHARNTLNKERLDRFPLTVRKFWPEEGNTQGSVV